MKSEQLASTFSIAVQPGVRCLVGLHGNTKEPNFEDINNLLEEDNHNVLHYPVDSDQVRFLVASQSLKPQGCQISLITIVESLEIEYRKHTFLHPDGEVNSLVIIPARPDWFISTYCSGARVWHLPNVDDENVSGTQIDEDVEGDVNDLIKDNVRSDSSCQNTLDYVTSLPLENYSSIKKMVSHPSTACANLACIVGSPLDSASPNVVNSSFDNYLVILQAPSESSSGDYQIASSCILSLPESTNGLSSKHRASAACSNPNALRWSPHDQNNQLVMAFDSGILGWDIRSMKPCFWLENPHWPGVRDLDYNPHRTNLLISGGDDGCVRVWDLRYLKSKYKSPPSTDRNLLNESKQSLGSVENRHFSSTTTDTLTHFNGGDHTVQPLYSIQAHSHWVWCVRYHPTRDQLILSSSSDCCVCLYSLAEYSSDAQQFRSSESDHGVGGKSLQQQQHPDDIGNDYCDNKDDDDDDDVQKMIMMMNSDSQSMFSNEEDNTTAYSTNTKNGLIGRLEHEESVYAADWSPVDSWYFASVSFDGNLLINQVPESIKLNILLNSKDY